MRLVKLFKDSVTRFNRRGQILWLVTFHSLDGTSKNAYHADGHQNLRL